MKKLITSRIASEPSGFVNHHVGMTGEECGSVKELFADGSIRVLVWTAMLVTIGDIS